MCNKLQLRTLAAESLGTNRFIVVSNREPFSHERRGGKVVCERPAGGLTSALHPILSALDRSLWVAQGTGSADWDVVDRCGRVQVADGEHDYTLRRVRVPEALAHGYYSGMANRGLWPLCHNAFQRPTFSSSDWRSYREVNALFARTVLEEAAGQPGVVFIQDYHFALLPRMVKEQNPALTVAHFWHIPWPSAETFSVFPWKDELLDGMLGNDLLGFQLNQHCANFLDAASQIPEALVDRQHRNIARESKFTAVRHFPIGIDFENHCAIAESDARQAATKLWRERIGDGVRVGIGIDRIDYTKGIPERMRALNLLFEQYPEWREKLVFVQVGVPSRSEIREYRELAEEIDREAAAVNRRWGTCTWQPVIFVARNLPPAEMIALHRLASFCLVTSLHDGMNLVAKEFVASRADLDGVLVLSRFAGACRELSPAIQVNPFCEDEIADGILTALTLPQIERRKRMIRMRAAVQTNNVYQWASDIVSAMGEIHAESVAKRMDQVSRVRAAGGSFA